MRRALLFGIIAAWIALIHSCGLTLPGTAHPEADASVRFDETNPLGANAACYVCHITFVKEELSRAHLQAKVGCIHCHGISAGHANDENIGATPPEVSFKRNQVDTMCLNCHKTHDIPPKQVIARWLERGLRKSPAVCTDCHGTHRIGKPTEVEEKDSAQEVNVRSREPSRDENDVDSFTGVDYPYWYQIVMHRV